LTRDAAAITSGLMLGLAVFSFSLMLDPGKRPFFGTDGIPLSSYEEGRAANFLTQTRDLRNRIGTYDLAVTIGPDSAMTTAHSLGDLRRLVATSSRISGFLSEYMDSTYVLYHTLNQQFDSYQSSSEEFQPPRHRRLSPDIVEAIYRWNNAAAALKLVYGSEGSQSRMLLIQALAMAIISPLVFLYAGVFAMMRRTIVGLLETLAFAEPPPA
jgi:hypothetical protein